MPESKRPMGRAFVGEVGCTHPVLGDVYYDGACENFQGTCVDFDCGSTVAVERPDGTKRQVVSYRTKRDADMHQVRRSA